ncbi:hypothetical protein [Paenibacillus medicaginis]|uniref:Uncharacterized protein n=1 Tax=Paenibacillus medicaginis TaxID=1470560 RepID=A0ABV5BUP9_9BACL
MKVSQKTVIDKIFEGIDQNGWTLLNGIGSGNFNSQATQKSMVEPLLKYLEKKGIEVTR